MTLLQYLKASKQKQKHGLPPVELTTSSLTAAPNSPISLRSLNNLHANIKQRIYRMLIPLELLARFDINPITWQGPDRASYVELEAKKGSGIVRLNAWSPFDPGDPFFTLELSDNSFNSIDLNWLILNDPASEKFDTDIDAEGNATLFGTVRRNIQAEQQAMESGLSPGQIHAGLNASSEVFHQIETFLIGLGQGSISLEPLNYASAWIFERRGFAYMSGHQLMKTIHEEFQPDGRLHAALDGGTPFRKPEQWQTVRGRAWAIHDGVLDMAHIKWTGLRMVKRLGHHAGINTFPEAIY